MLVIAVAFSCCTWKRIFGHGVGRGGGSKRDCKVYGVSVFSRGNKASTIGGKLVAVQHFHRRVGIELPMKHFIVKLVKAGIARESALTGEPQRIRRPISWVTLKQGLSMVPEWGEGGKVLWIMLAVSYFYFGRASEMFAYNDGKTH